MLTTIFQCCIYILAAYMTTLDWNFILKGNAQINLGCYLNIILKLGLNSVHFRLSSQLSTIGFQPISSEFMKITPPRDTVPGEQWVMFVISKSNFMLGANGIRSLVISVNILLSS